MARRRSTSGYRTASSSCRPPRSKAPDGEPGQAHRRAADHDRLDPDGRRRLRRTWHVEQEKDGHAQVRREVQGLAGRRERHRCHGLAGGHGGRPGGPQPDRRRQQHQRQPLGRTADGHQDQSRHEEGEEDDHHHDQGEPDPSALPGAWQGERHARAERRDQPGRRSQPTNRTAPDGAGSAPVAHHCAPRSPGEPRGQAPSGTRDPLGCGHVAPPLRAPARRVRTSA